MAATAPFAAMITLGHRLPLFFEAARGSSAWNDPEFVRMSTEKVQAAGQAASSMSSAFMAGQQAIADYALAETSSNLTLIMTPPKTVTEIQTRAEVSLKRFSQLIATLGEISARSLATGLRPAHRKVTANAKRLGAKRHRRGG